MKTVLKNRTLWFDGTSQVAPELVPELLLEGVPPSKIVVTELNDDIKQFNRMSEIMMGFGKEANAALSLAYNIPKRYKDLDVDEYLRGQAKIFVIVGSDGPFSDEQKAEYLKRTEDEILEIRSRGMEMLVRTLIYVLDSFKQSGTVWGVGRGSSCASLALFLIGLHKVNPVKYRIPMTEFFH